MIEATTVGFAPAKVNLYLHVAPPRSDGMHPVASLMVFADVGDRLSAIPGGGGVMLTVTGLFAAEIEGLDPSTNLVVRAARRLAERVGAPEPDIAFSLDKALPTAAGLGGGSSDAGAALRLTARILGVSETDPRLAEVAAELGADCPACLMAQPVLGLGNGDELHSAPSLPVLHAVLVNSGAACPTGAVYRAYDASGAPGVAAQAGLGTGLDFDGLVDALRRTRNDLEPPAAALVPEVAETLALIAAQPQAAFTRLSGSGATVFALCADAASANDLAAAVHEARPGWWARPCRLGGPWPDTLTKS